MFELVQKYFLKKRTLNFLSSLFDKTIDMSEIMSAEIMRNKEGNDAEKIMR